MDIHTTIHYHARKSGYRDYVLNCSSCHEKKNVTCNLSCVMSGCVNIVSSQPTNTTVQSQTYDQLRGIPAIPLAQGTSTIALRSSYECQCICLPAASLCSISRRERCDSRRLGGITCRMVAYTPLHVSKKQQDLEKDYKASGSLILMELTVTRDNKAGTKIPGRHGCRILIECDSLVCTASMQRRTTYKCDRDIVKDGSQRILIRGLRRKDGLLEHMNRYLGVVRFERACAGRA